MNGEPPRWNGQKSSFSWEQDALDFIRQHMPETEPYRAWQTFTFTGTHGHVREVDLLLAAPGGLFLVEIKSHPGRAANDGSTWMFRNANVTRTIENPLHFTDQKAKELRQQLQKAANDTAKGLKIPRIEVAVFLSAENLRCDFDDFQTQRVYARDGRKDQTNLDGIWREFLNQPPLSEKNRVTPTLSKQLPKLLQQIGTSRLHKIGKVGSYDLETKSFDAGPTWEDYLARNPALPDDQPRRVRVYVANLDATDDDRKSIQRAARREYLALQGISHDGIVRAEQYSDELLVGPAVVFRHGADWQRLDHFLAANNDTLAPETRLEMIRQLAEALDHAHRRHLYHRALSPRSVYVELDGHYPRLRIADWLVAARPHGSTTPGPATRFSDPSALMKHIERSAGPYLAPEFMNQDAPPALLDVFGLGALSYLILTGTAPADDRQHLARKLTDASEHALTPSSVADSISLPVDALVREATAASPTERTGSVGDFLKALDPIEQSLTDPEADLGPEPDPLKAVKGDVISGWTVENVLGKGSTSRALLVKREIGEEHYAKRVFKVALDDAAARRLHKEAAQLDQLKDSHVVSLLDPPFQAGPPGQSRTLIGVEYLKDTLGEELRKNGPLSMTINEIEQLGEDLFQSVTFLDKRQIWHRDIKPDNLGFRQLPRKRRELVLFDFSLAGIPDTEINAGTPDYLDPFLGPPNRLRYDLAAELYAVAVTLHEMVSGELPSWGDGITPAGFLRTQVEEAQLAEDVFDSVIRDGLVRFFRKALHPDATQRYPSVQRMAHAWIEIFKDVETQPPATTASTESDEDESEETLKAKRDAAAASATPDTGLVAAGLSAHALSAAQRHLNLSTAGDLARTPTKRITHLKGFGREPKFELIKRSMEWRQEFQVSETDLPRVDIQEGQQLRHPERPVASPSLHPLSVPGATAENLKRLPLDEVARRLVPEVPELRQVTGLAAGANGQRVSPWASRQEVVQTLGASPAEAAMHLERLHARWAKSVKGLLEVREDVAKIVREHGRILPADRTAATLLARRGAELGDAKERMRAALLCVRAAVEVEERRDKNARLLSRRAGSAMLVALTDAEEKGAAPRAGDLFAYAELLGEEADKLSDRDPLPGLAEIRETLRAVDMADYATRLSDTDLVELAAAASKRTAATKRLELYPRTMAKDRALKLSQPTSLLGNAEDAEFARRVRDRFPDLIDPPTAEEIPALLKKLEYDIERRKKDNVLVLRSSTNLNSADKPKRGGRSTTPGSSAHAVARLEEARRIGGFVTVKAPVVSTITACDYLVNVPGVTPLDVTRTFVNLLQEVVQEQGRPRWETVLAADSPSASPAARTGFATLLGKTWERFDAHVRTIGNSGIVLLHDATPLARYSGGMDVLAKLAVAARDSGESPHGLWLLCPMKDPKKPPRLDGVLVGVIPGDAEQLYVPDGFGSGKEQKAS